MIRPFCFCMLAHSMATLIRGNQTIGDSFMTLFVGIFILQLISVSLGSTLKQNNVLTTRKRSLRRLCFLHVSVILSTRGLVSQHALQVVSQHALQVSRGWYPNMPCRSPGPHPGGKLRGLAGGGGVSRPTPRGLQVHTQGSVSRPTPAGGSPACTEADTPPDGYCCGQYASYWNAFLFVMRFVLTDVILV